MEKSNLITLPELQATRGNEIIKKLHLSGVAFLFRHHKNRVVKLQILN